MPQMLLPFTVQNSPLGGLAPADSIMGDSSKPTEVNVSAPTPGSGTVIRDPDYEPVHPRQVYSGTKKLIMNLRQLNLKIFQVDPREVKELTGISMPALGNSFLFSFIPQGEIWTLLNWDNESKLGIMEEIIKMYLFYTLKDVSYDQATDLSKKIMTLMKKGNI